MSGTASRLQVYSAHYLSEFWIFTFSLDNGYLLGIMEGKEEDCQVWSCDSTHIIRVNNGVLGNPKVNFLIHVTILQIWYFFNHQSSKFGFFHTNICVLVRCTILSKKFSEKLIILAEKPHYATQMFSQPQQIIFFMNNRLTGGWNSYANPFVILLY